MAKRTLQERIIYANTMGCQHLGNANEAAEKGNQAKADKLYAKAQFWLDRYNLLVGDGEKAPPKR